MAPSNDGVPTERTSLLSKSSKSNSNSNNNGKAIDSYSSDEITASESYSSIGDENGSILKGGDENVVDEETGEIEEEDDNPLFEGNPDVNMRLLFPAVALGVSGFYIYPLPNFGMTWVMSRFFKQVFSFGTCKL